MRGQLELGFSTLLPLRIIPARAGPTCFRFHGKHDAPDHPRSCGANGLLQRAHSHDTGSSPLVRGQRCPGWGCPRNRLDHPRSCGANHIASTFSSIGSGSSPLVRGQHVFADVRVQAIRIIPARAGPTSTLGMTVVRPSDHPRSCGANAVCRHLRTVSVGSSPLVRGQQGYACGLAVDFRIIPARAGPTRVPARSARRAADHPRSCGANEGSHPGVVISIGSSPLVRGQQSVLLQ